MMNDKIRRNGPFRKRWGRVAALVVAAALTVGASACTSASEVNGQAGDGGNGAASTSNKIAFDYPFTSVSLYAPLVQMMTAAAEARGYEVVTTDDAESLDRQVSNLTGLATSDVAAIVSFPLEPASVINIMKQAQGNGIKWVTYAENIEGQDGFIDFAGEKTGRAQVESFVAWADANGITSGTVLLGTNETVNIGRTRTNGMREALAELAPGFTVVEQAAVNVEQGLAAGRAELAKNPDLVAGLGVNDDVAMGLAQAFKEAGRTGSDLVYVGGNDGNPQLLQMIKDPDSVVRGTVAFDVAAVGAALANVPIDLIEGKGDGSYVIEYWALTADSPQLDEILAGLG